MAANGYPEKTEKNIKLTALEKPGNPDIGKSLVFHAGTKNNNGELLSNGGRILNITGIGRDLTEAKKVAYEKIKKLQVKFGDFVVAENGKISDNYNEEKLKEYMKWDSIVIEVNLKLGNDAPIQIDSC